MMRPCLFRFPGGSLWLSDQRAAVQAEFWQAWLPFPLFPWRTEVVNKCTLKLSQLTLLAELAEGPLSQFLLSQLVSDSDGGGVGEQGTGERTTGGTV